MRIFIPLLALLLAFLMVQLAEHSYFYSGNEIIGNTFSFDQNQNQLISLPVIVGLIFVFVFYWIKFNDWAGEGMAPTGFHPRPTRHYTTSVRYFLWNGFYGLIMAATYFMLVYFPEPIYRLLQGYIDAAKSVNASVPSGADLFLKIGDQYNSELLWPKERLAPYAAILMTVVWSGVRPFSIFERRIRLHWQELAAIPSQARQLVETFEKEEDSFSPDHQVVSKVVKHLPHRPLTPEDFELKPGDSQDSGNSLWFLYARLSYLNYLFQKYNRFNLFSRLAERYYHDFREFEERISPLHELILQRITDIQNFVPEAQPEKNVIRNIYKPILQRITDFPKPHSEANELQVLPQTQENKAQRKKNESQPTLKDMEIRLQDHLEKENSPLQPYFEKQEEEIRTEIKTATRDVVQFIVCGVLAVGNSLNQRHDLLEKFGFRQPKISIPLDMKTITKAAGSIVLITFVITIIYYLSIKFIFDVSTDSKLIPQNPSGVLYWSVLACIMHLLAIITSYFTQCSMETHRRHQMVKEPEQLSPEDQAVEGIWAACVGFSLNVVLMGILSATAGHPESLVQNWWWALVPGVTAFFAALYTQKIKRTSKQMRMLFWAQGISTGFMATLVCLFTLKLDLEQTDEKIITAVFWLYVTLLTTVIGWRLAKTLHDWVKAYYYSGKLEKRQAKRKRPFFMFNERKWITDEGEQWVRAITFSKTGAELRAMEKLEPESEGKIELEKGETVRAKVIRSEKSSPNTCFVKVIDETT